jgi:predicted component of type VI protein secretion system
MDRGCNWRRVNTMPPQLVALTEGSNILLDKPILLLGRHQECDVQLGSRKVSRRHCCLAQVANYVVVRDLGSTNGIRINGVRVHEGCIQPGDELTIGNQRFQLQWPSRVEKAAPPTANPIQAAPGRLALPAVPVPAAPGKPAAAASVADPNLESSEVPIPLPEPHLALPANGSSLPPSIFPNSIKLAPLNSQKPGPG